MARPDPYVTVRLQRTDAWWLRVHMGALRDTGTNVDEIQARLRFALDEALGAPRSNGSGLDGPGQARANDVGTAKAAAASLGKPGNKRRRVLQAIIDAGSAGLTAEEAVGRTGIEYRTLTPRVGELKRDGYVEALEGVTRPGTHGAQQQVLVATVLGAREMGAGR
jgi:hypothetical protein